MQEMQEWMFSNTDLFTCPRIQEDFSGAFFANIVATEFLIVKKMILSLTSPKVLATWSQDWLVSRSNSFSSNLYFSLLLSLTRLVRGSLLAASVEGK